MSVQTMENRFTSVWLLATGSAVALPPFPEVVECWTQNGASPESAGWTAIGTTLR